MNDWLITKHGTSANRDYCPQRILSYGYNCFYVRTESQNLPSVTIFDTLGNFVGLRWTVNNEEHHKTPLWSYTPLMNAYTRQPGFPKK